MTVVKLSIVKYKASIYHIVMNRFFNPFLLHSDIDIHPRTWICLRGEKLRKVFRDLKEVVKKENQLSTNALTKFISSEYKCSPNTIGRIMYGSTKYYPIPIFIEMLKLCRNPKKFAKTIIKNTRYLKVNSASAKPVKAVKRLNRNLAKILGAFMADGNLSIQVIFANFDLNSLDSLRQNLEKRRIKHSLGKVPSRNQFYISVMANKQNLAVLNELIASYTKLIKIQTHFNIELTDEYRDNVDTFREWLGEEFDIQPNSLQRKKNAWRVIFSSKILARYLIIFFGVTPGSKTYTAFEPMIIKSSPLLIRKAFARGVLMFDGCVTKNNRILLSVVSKDLHESIKEIWKKANIQFGVSLSKRRGQTEYCIFSTAGNRINKLLEYFETGTQKEKLMRWLMGDLNSHPIIPTNGSSVSTQKILESLGEIRKCDSEFLKEQFKCTHTTIRIYLKILKAQGKIILSNQPNGISDYTSKTTTVLLKRVFHNLIFQKIKDQFYLNNNFAKYLGVHKSTLSAWRTQKNRMPLYILKEFCNILHIDYNQALQNVIKTDREIVTII